MPSEPTAERPVIATYMHLPSPKHFRPALIDDPNVTSMEARESLPEFYRFLYAAVGQGFSWVDRLSWTNGQLREHLARPEVTLLVLYIRGTPAGYIELDEASDEPGTEIRYLGIFPGFHGRGLGKHLLSIGVRRAFNDGATRVWLSTRSTDGAHAIANYMARGFLTYRTDTEPAPAGPPHSG